MIRDAVVRSLPYAHYLATGRTREPAAQLTAHGAGGGAVDDALVAAAAVDRGAYLATRDVQALPTYAAMRADVLALTCGARGIARFLPHG